MGRKRGRRRSPFKFKLKKDTLYSIGALFLMASGLLIIISFSGQGVWLQSIQSFMSQRFGLSMLFIPFILFISGLMLTQVKLKIAKPTVLLGGILLFVAFMGLLRTGTIGQEIFTNISVLIQPLGAYILLVGIIIAGLLILTESSLDEIILFFQKVFSATGDLSQKAKTLSAAKPGFATNHPGMTIKGGRDDLKINAPPKPTAKEAIAKSQKTTPKAGMELSANLIANNPGETGAVYQNPSVDLLDDDHGGEADRGDIKLNASIIEQTLESFGIGARVVEVNLGPAVTQYALEIKLGTKLSRITGLQNDLALALAAPTGQIRIEAPIPGRALVGIEIPNHSAEYVSLKRIITADAIRKAKPTLTVGLGLNVSGVPVAADIAKMPHVLIAGATGSGKSVAVNAFILQILFRSSPEQVKFILVDPKRVELTQYNGIPHLLTPVIVEPEKVVAALEWAINEMENRYKTFAEVGVRNIEGYNDLSGFQKLPYIIIIIDELADIMLFAPNKVEDAITRLAQMARATGIHLLLATQRPSVDVITGLIKANIPARIAFNVTSMIDSRVIIDSPGAEKLLGKGDMLYIPPDQAKPSRIQGTYVTDKETKQVLDFIKRSGVKPEYTEEVTTKYAAKKIVGTDGVVEDQDPHFEDAIKVITNSDKASASLLQRRLSIGYARAARILDQLEKAGIVGPADGSKPREVLVSSHSVSSSTDSE
jgi:DNA segregation ATPase FtsK/SpoIIIE, S-DNA-T family